MMGDFDIENLRDRLSKIMERKGIKPTTLSLSIGKSPTLVRDLLEKTSDVKLSTLYKLADQLDVQISDLLDADGDLAPVPLGPKLFVKGSVAAGEWMEAYEWPHEEWREFTGRSDVTADPEHRFGLRIEGDSMDEIYPPGTIVECVSLFGRAEAVPGKKVVVVRKREDDLVEATVKELVEIDGRLWLRPRSHNPAHRAYALDDDSENIVETRIVAVVVSSVREE